METKDLILGKAKYEDWEAMYRNVWSRPETARYMQWRVVESEEEARVRIQKTIAFQETNDSYLVYEKKSGQPIGFAGVSELEPRIYEEAGIAIGPEYVGKGYGKQILQFLLEYCAKSLGGKEFIYSTHSTNTASKALAVSCGFSFRYAKQKIDLRNGEPYVLEVYGKKLSADA